MCLVIITNCCFQGSADGFLASQLMPQNFTAAASAKGNCPVTMRMQPGYDHSYYFISTFMAEHMAFHAANLGAF